MTAADTSVSPDARRVWRAARAPVVIVLAVLLTGVVLVLARGGGDAALDPRSYGPGGTRALTRLLAEQGVRVEPVYSSADADPAGATVLVARPGLVEPDTLAALARRSAHLVLVAPDEAALEAVADAVTTAGDGQLGTEARPPDCALPAATGAGVAELGGTAYRGPVTCYGGGLARAGDVTVLAGGHPLTNGALAEEGNAALAMRLLGAHERLVWYLPSAGDPGLRDGDRSLYALLPRGWVFGAVQAGIAVALLALWRARRLGRVVTEPLPVVVRAAETVEGRARLYRRAAAADHAAQALREASLRRLRPLAGLGRDAAPETVVAAVAARTGRAPAEVGAVLYGPAWPGGPPPLTDDSQLVRLADALDALERESEVRQ
ncbi:uncharacterized protein DUF4350 [Prauserella shujinwangii]|uniref:Uncharacterized protein DUF4350 n=1 Tax=Prauserella shujinwangii TaxID=1453103 RepID=A0A2T0LM73_9PSEU|nr:DUF4350 domain-containing protein [Prauserella shujinwangii]PRX44181.1 uncharacterized protein DUF4350 [Prauserella shujinwangii]